MIDLIQAADDCRQLLRRFQAIEAVATALDAVGSLVQAEKEAKDSLQALNAEVELAKGELSATKLSNKKLLESLKNKQDAEIAIHTELMEKSLEGARKQTELIMTDALEKQQIAQDVVNKLQGAALVLSEQNKSATEALATLKANVAKVQAQANKLLGG